MNRIAIALGAALALTSCGYQPPTHTAAPSTTAAVTTRAETTSATATAASKPDRYRHDVVDRQCRDLVTKDVVPVGGDPAKVQWIATRFYDDPAVPESVGVKIGRPKSDSPGRAVEELLEVNDGRGKGDDSVTTEKCYGNVVGDQVQTALLLEWG